MALVTSIGALVVAAQDYCLIYRMTVVLENKRIHEVFVSHASYVAFHVAIVLVAITIGVPFFHSVPTDRDVSSSTRDCYSPLFVLFRDFVC